MSAVAAGRALDSANHKRDKRLTVGCVRCSIDDRDSASVTREHKFLGGNRGILCVEEFR